MLMTNTLDVPLAEYYVCQLYTNCYLEIRIQLAGGNEMISLHAEAHKGEEKLIC